VTPVGSRIVLSRRRLAQLITLTPILRWLVIRLSAPAGEPPRTNCPACGIRLDVLSPATGPTGRCACGHRVGPPPFSIEAVAVICASLVAVAPLSPWERAAYGWWAACGVVLAITDVAVHRLPRPVAFAAAVGLLLVLGPPGLFGHGAAWLRATEAALAITAVLVLLALLPTGLGGGDVTAGLAVGAAAGWISWFAAVAALFAAFLLVAIVGLVLMVAGRATPRTPMPLGPALLAGTLLVVVMLRVVGH
jgi:leader peptidase (prepilin peptidase)/N-methyltransferase